MPRRMADRIADSLDTRADALEVEAERLGSRVDSFGMIPYEVRPERARLLAQAEVLREEAEKMRAFDVGARGV